jgi:hypothetical protein
MALTKVLIAVTTYPLPSRSYDELVCTAGFLENGDWIRIYPIPLSFILDLKGSGKVKNTKYTWIELELVKRTDDFRPESYSPKHYDFRDVIIHNSINTKNNWYLRKQFCLKNIDTDLTQLIEESKAPTNKSLSTFKPTEILALEWESADREWKNEWKELRKQGDLFDTDKSPEILIPKLPYTFFYKFKDDKGRISRLMIEDWEIGALFWKYEEKQALQKVKDKYETKFKEKNDVYFFLGTTKQWHMRRSKNPFVIIGVFYPLKESQLSLFSI